MCRLKLFKLAVQKICLYRTSSTTIVREESGITCPLCVCVCVRVCYQLFHLQDDDGRVGFWPPCPCVISKGSVAAAPEAAGDVPVLWFCCGAWDNAASRNGMILHCISLLEVKSLVQRKRRAFNDALTLCCSSFLFFLPPPIPIQERLLVWP